MSRILDVHETKQRLEKFLKTINTASPTNQFKLQQQDKKKEHIFVAGGNGRLAVQPMSKGYDIGLSSQSLVGEMYGFMVRLCGRECDGYKQTKPKKHVPFWRVDDFGLVEKAILSYAGIKEKRTPHYFPDEIDEPAQYVEGASKVVRVNVYERNPKARRACIEHHGCSCLACDFNFKDTYGDYGESFIHVHHIVPLADIKKEYVLDPIKDLIPLCPNCHAMIHRTGKALSLNQLKQLLLTKEL
jgi:predicted HNH restriction endonuclease